MSHPPRWPYLLTALTTLTTLATLDAHTGPTLEPTTQPTPTLLRDDAGDHNIIEPPPPTTTTPTPTTTTAAATATATAQRITTTTTPHPPAPTDGNCESWRPWLTHYHIPADQAIPIMWRESRCTGHAYNGNTSTGDDSYGVLQINRAGTLAQWWDSGGYTREVMATWEGALAAAATLYGACRWGPWTRPYTCNGTYQTTPSPTWAEWQQQPHQ